MKNSDSFLEACIWFSMCSVMIVVFKSWPFYFFSNLNWFYIFLFSDCHGKTFKTKLNKSGKRGHACLVPDIRGNAFSFSPLRMMFATGLSSVQFRHSVVSDSLRPYGLQHTRLPCSSPTARAYSNSCPLGQWCHPTISSSVVPLEHIYLLLKIIQWWVISQWQKEVA